MIAKLFAAARENHGAARSRLLDRFEPLLLRLVRRELGPERYEREGEDLLQVVRVSILESIGRLRRWELPSFVTWIKRLVHCRVLDWEKSRQNPKRRTPRGGRFVRLPTEGVGVPARDPTPSRLLLGREEVDRLRAAIEEVSERYRPLLRFLSEEDPSPLEVAAFLKKGPEAARKFTGRALTRLRAALERRGGSTGTGG